MKIPKSAMLFASLGVEISVSVLGGIGIGYLIDSQLGTSPIFLIAGCLLGAAGAMVRLVKRARQLGEGTGRGEGEARDGES